jgi:hypothetical protein
MTFALTIIFGHLLLLIGLRVWFGLFGSESPKVQAFLKLRKFKVIVLAYVVVVLSLIVVPIVLYMR